MRLLSRVRVGLLAIVGFGCLIASRGAAEPRRSATLESPLVTINVRKIARKLLRLGQPSADAPLLWLGPARARLLWQKTWKWPDCGKHHKLAGGLLGGPVLSVDMPLGPIDDLLSLETRFSSSRYAYPHEKPGRSMLEELAKPQDRHQSLEAGLYINFAFGRLF